MIFHYGLLLLCIAGVLGIDNSHLREGEPCQLPSDKLGKCRKMLACPQRDLSTNLTPRMRCKSTRHHARVVCCPPITAQAMCKMVPMHFEPRISNHIVGNTELADVGEFPFMGLLIFEDRTKRCGAALITNKLLLTAAHCFRRENTTEVLLGTTAANDGGAERYEIGRIVRHPDFKWKIIGSSPADIAFVELRQEVKFDNETAPLCLYGSLQDLPTNENLTVVGWGFTDTGPLATPDALMKGTVQTVPLNECQVRYREVKKVNITSGHLCAQGDVDSKQVYTDACEGDSGGPLVKLVGSKYFLVGIVSGGRGCGVQQYPGLYTRVASYMDWITNEIEATYP